MSIKFIWTLLHPSVCMFSTAKPHCSDVQYVVTPAGSDVAETVLTQHHHHHPMPSFSSVLILLTYADVPRQHCSTVLLLGVPHSPQAVIQRVFYAGGDAYTVGKAGDERFAAARLVLRATILLRCFLVTLFKDRTNCLCSVLRPRISAIISFVDCSRRRV